MGVGGGGLEGVGGSSDHVRPMEPLAVYSGCHPCRPSRLTSP